MLSEIFSDYFAQRRNFLTRIDARIKLAFIAAIMLINLTAKQILLPATITLFAFCIILALKIPLKVIILRLFSPLAIALVLLVIQIFFRGDTVLFKLHLLNWEIIGFKEGFYYGLFVMGKIIAAVSLMLLLSMSTPVNKLFNTLRWFKVPLVWIEIGLLVYRYIFVFLEDAISIKNAQKLRLGYSGYRISKKSVGVLAGSMFIRAYDQAVNTFQAMLLRGYGGYKNDTDKKY